MGTFLDKVKSPDVMAPARSKPDTGTVIQPETTSFGLFRRHLQPFSPPDPSHTLGIHMPALSAKQGCDPAIAVTAKLAGKVDNRFGKRRFVIGDLGNITLGRSRLTKHATGTPFRNAKCLLDMMHADPTTASTQKFSDAASFRMSLSSVRSATAFLSLAFSRSSSFRRLA